MRLSLLLDEDTQAKQLIQLLREATHDVRTVSEAGLTDQSDSAVFAYSQQERRIILTRNCADFQTLHTANPSHPGIVCVYQYNNRQKDMSYADIVKAIANLEASGWDFHGEFVVLNQWHFTLVSDTSK